MSTLTNNAHMDNFTGMKKTDRNNEIIARHVAGEALSDIGKSFGITRARAQRIFKDYSTKADVKLRNKNREKPEPEPYNGHPDFPKNEDRVRIHVPGAKSSEIGQSRVRAGIRRWLNGEFPITDDIQIGNRMRMDIVVASNMHIGLCARCAELNLPVATTIRGIIAYLENEK